MKLDRVTPESVGIPSKKIENFLDDLTGAGVELHSFMLLRHGRVCAEGYARPYDAHTPHIMFSFSKSLTSTAIGFAEREGILSLEEKLVDIFPDRLPAQVSENLAACRVEDLLMMGCGHESEIETIQDKHWIRDFLAQPFVYEPGTHFMYNTAGTNMLSAILQRKTGQTLTEFLKPRLFDPLGMNAVTCFTLPDGVEAGGFGMKMVTEDMARFIQFVANRGLWEGKELLGEAWWSRAATKRIENKGQDQPNEDWKQGYGYQFWCCQPDQVFRADGAFGQYGIVMPKQDAVLVITSAEMNMQAALEIVWRKLLTAIGTGSADEDPIACQSLRQTCARMALPEMISMRNEQTEKLLAGKRFAPAEVQPSFFKMIGGAGRFKETPGSLSALFFIFEDDKGYLCAEEDTGVYRFRLGMQSRFACTMMGDEPYWSVARWRAHNKLEAEIRNTTTCSGTRFLFTFNGEVLTLSMDSTIPMQGGLGDEIRPEITFHAG